MHIMDTFFLRLPCTDWSFQALQSLIEKYGLLAGYRDGTFRGNQTMTRYEFAAVLQKAIALLTQNLNSVTPEDLSTLQRLEREFAPQLKVLSGRINSLEQRVARITDTSFSTTTKLDGEVIFALTAVEGSNKANNEEDIDSNLTLGSRVRLNFDTSFYGEDRLRTRLQSTNLPLTDEAAGTSMARLSFRGDDDSEFSLSRLEYAFPVSERVEVYLEGN
jgi:cysteinyl-tRNA synthetase